MIPPPHQKNGLLYTSLNSLLLDSKSHGQNYGGQREIADGEENEDHHHALQNLGVFLVMSCGILRGSEPGLCLLDDVVNAEVTQQQRDQHYGIEEDEKIQWWHLVGCSRPR